jgi:hypothetical protein
MNQRNRELTWGVGCLASRGYSIEQKPEVILSTPWSTIYRIPTTTETFYLKKTPAPIFLSNEPKIIQHLFNHFHANVPVITDINEDLHCFLMNDAGIPLRQRLKLKFEPDFLYCLVWEVVLGYQFILIVNLQAYKAYYPNKPNPVIEGLRKFLSMMNAF